MSQSKALQSEGAPSGNPREDIRFLLNGAPVKIRDVPATTTLLDWLRETRRLTGTKEGCNEGDCGACTVSVAHHVGDRLEHRAVNACIQLLAHLDGTALRTVEGLGTPDALDPVQDAMVTQHGSQCGFCTPGFVMSIHAARHEGRRDHDNVLAGNLCRCTGYAPIVRAAQAVEDAPPAPWLAREAEALTALNATNSVICRDAAIPSNIADLFAQMTAWPDATLVAGATDIGLWITKHLADPAPLIFLHRVPELLVVGEDETGLRIGAGVTLARLRGLMAGRHPDFAELIRRYGSVQVRNVATIGGNIANGSPIGDGPPALIALSAKLRLRSEAATRDIALEDFFVDYGRQDLARGEIVDSVHIPATDHTLACYKISKRFDQDISALCGCFLIGVEGDRVSAASLAFGGMAATPKRAHAAEDALIGQPWTEATMANAAKALEDDFSPIDDMRASARYRLQTAGKLLIRHYAERELGLPRLVGRGAIS